MKTRLSAAAPTALLVVCLAVSGCPGNVMCIRAVRCVQVCGGPALSSGCGPCGAGTFDDITCVDAGTDAGALADSGFSPDADRLDASASDGGSIRDGGPPTGCAVNSDCALTARTCCGNCGSPALGDFTAVHTDDVGDYRNAVCSAEGFPPCALCDLPPDPYLVAVCTAAACTGVDLRTEALTECAAASDCTLAPRECCSCGVLGVSETIAYNSARGNPNGYLCDAGAPACPPCVPSFDAVMPDCVGGRCVVVASP